VFLSFLQLFWLENIFEPKGVATDRLIKNIFEEENEKKNPTKKQKQNKNWSKKEYRPSIDFVCPQSPTSVIFHVTNQSIRALLANGNLWRERSPS